MNEKQKIQGVENKELYLFVAIIIIIIVLLMFEMFFFEGRKDVVEEMATAEAELQEMANETVSKEQKDVYKVINAIVDMLNKKDYEGLYNDLKDDYKNYYFRDFENFKSFINIYAKEEYYPKYGSYYRSGDLYYVIVDFLKSEYTREDLLTQRANKVDTLVLEEVEKGNFKFALNGFVENISHNTSKTVDGVTFTLQSSLRNTETMETTVMISNKSDKALSVSTTNIQPNVSGSNTAKLSATSSVNLEPGEFGTLSIEYYFQYDTGREFNGVTISGVKFDDGTIMETFSIYK